MDPKPNFNNNLSDIKCDKDLVVENGILKVKLEEADDKNTFVRDEVKDLKVLLKAKIQTSSHNFKTNAKECFLQENFYKYKHNLAFQLIPPKATCCIIKITFQIKEILSFRKLTVV